MCDKCWETAGSPRIETPEVHAAVACIDPVYDESAVGGHLHILLDDWNVDDDDLEFCEKDADPGLTVAEAACLAAFRLLTPDQRMSALALHDGLWVTKAAQTI